MVTHVWEYCGVIDKGGTMNRVHGYEHGRRVNLIKGLLQLGDSLDPVLAAPDAPDGKCSR